MAKEISPAGKRGTRPRASPSSLSSISASTLIRPAAAGSSNGTGDPVELKRALISLCWEHERRTPSNRELDAAARTIASFPAAEKADPRRRTEEDEVAAAEAAVAAKKERRAELELAAAALKESGVMLTFGRRVRAVIAGRPAVATACLVFLALTTRVLRGPRTTSVKCAGPTACTWATAR